MRSRGDTDHGFEEAEQNHKSAPARVAELGSTATEGTILESGHMTPISSQMVHVRPAENEIDPAELTFQKLKVALHEALVDSLDLSMLSEISESELASEVQAVAAQMCHERAADLKGFDPSRMLRELLDEIFGLGPLESLMQDPKISDILVNNSQSVYIERDGRLEQTAVLFADDQHLLRIIQRIVSRVGRRIDEVSPLVDARLADGSRIHAVIPPLALDGPVLSIRRFGTRPLQVEDLIASQSVSRDIAEFLAVAIDARISLLVSGGTGAGKTTLLNALTIFIPPDERLITIEDSAELKLLHKHVIRLETRPLNTEGTGEVNQRILVRNSLRMRPDRIIVGEVRGPEALDMLQAMNTGHEGSLTTIHANDTRDALSRLEMMVAMTGYEIPVPVVREYIAAGISLIVQLARLKGGVRRVTRVSEIVGVSEGVFQVEDIFGFEQNGVDANGIAKGHFYTTGYRPHCLARIKASGVLVSENLFKATSFQPLL
jgi:pilus assembly protein CpaF